MTDTERARAAQKVEEPLHELIDELPLDSQSSLRRNVSAMLSTLGGPQFLPKQRNSPLVEQMAQETAEASKKQAVAAEKQAEKRAKDRPVLST